MGTRAGGRPGVVGFASALLCLAFGVGLGLTGRRLLQANPSAPALLVCMLLLAFAALATLVYFAFRGHDRARMACVSLVGVRTVVGISRASSEFAYSSSAAAISLVLVAIELLAAFLLLSRPSTAWFKRSRSTSSGS